MSISEKVQTALQEIYAETLASAIPLYRAAKKKGLEVTQKQVKEWLLDQEAEQIHKKVIKPKVFLPVVPDDHLATWVLDLGFLPLYKNYNKGYHSYLAAIHMTTRKAVVVPLKKKDAGTILEAFETFIQKADPKPQKINTDAGSEWTNKRFEKYLSQHSIEHTVASVGDHTGAQSIIESFNRTLKAKISKWVTAHKNFEYVPSLNKIVQNYNNTEHSTLKKAPNDMTQKDQVRFRSKQVSKFIYLKSKINKYVIGDRVRLQTPPEMFKKGDAPKYHQQIYKVVQIEGNKYKLQNEKGDILHEPHKAQELRKVNKSVSLPQQAKSVAKPREELVNEHKVERRQTRAKNELKLKDKFIEQPLKFVRERKPSRKILETSQ
jgi:transposase InsO family protein